MHVIIKINHLKSHILNGKKYNMQNLNSSNSITGSRLEIKYRVNQQFQINETENMLWHYMIAKNTFKQIYILKKYASLYLKI